MTRKHPGTVWTGGGRSMRRQRPPRVLRRCGAIPMQARTSGRACLWPSQRRTLVGTVGQDGVTLRSELDSRSSWTLPRLSAGGRLLPCRATRSRVDTPQQLIEAHGRPRERWNGHHWGDRHYRRDRRHRLDRWYWRYAMDGRDRPSRGAIQVRYRVTGMVSEPAVAEVPEVSPSVRKHAVPLDDGST